MKKIGSIFLLSFTLISLFSCKEFEKGDLKFSFYVASDTHYLSESLIGENNDVYVKSYLTSDGRVQEYDEQILDSFIKEIKINKPEYAFFTGDLTFNGEYQSHIDLRDKLMQVKDTKVLVIPGNHDCFNLYSRSFYDDDIQSISSITKDEFKAIYNDFGYAGGLTYDEESLSYFYKLNDETWALMLDTTLTQFNQENNANVVGGQLFDSTYSWIEENLKIAYEKNIDVISFSHHNLLVHHERSSSGFTLYDNERLLNLFKKYHVNLNMSGHLHIQNIKKNDNVYDIASGSLIDYGNRYGVVDVYENAYDYHTKKISLEEIDLDEYAFKVFYQKYYDKQYDFYQLFYKEYEYEKMLDLVSKINAYFFDENYQEVNKIYKENRSLLNTILKEDSKSYIASIIKIENKNQFDALIKK